MWAGIKPISTYSISAPSRLSHLTPLHRNGYLSLRIPSRWIEYVYPISRAVHNIGTSSHDTKSFGVVFRKVSRSLILLLAQELSWRILMGMLRPRFFKTSAFLVRVSRSWFRRQRQLSNFCDWERKYAVKSTNISRKCYAGRIRLKMKMYAFISLSGMRHAF